MKTFNLFLTILCGILFFSCQDDGKIKLESKNFVAPVLESNTVENIKIDEITQLDSVLIIASWSASNYGVEKIAVKYVLEMDSVGNEFSAPVELLSVENNLEAKITAEKLKKYALSKAGKAGDHQLSVEIRIKSTLSDDSAYNLYSNAFAFSYAVKIDSKPPKDVVYLVGNLIFELPEWGNSEEGIGKGLQLLFADDSKIENKKYTYTGLFKGDGFKLPTKAGDWDTAYGWKDGKIVTKDGDNIPGVKAEGYYTLNVDLEAMTSVITPFPEGKNATRQVFVALIGDASPSGSWEENTNMKEVTPHVWILKKAEMKAGGFKFRNSTDWSGTAWGANGEDAEKPFGKTSTEGDAQNFKIEKAGNYYIQFNDLTMHYIIIPMADLK